MIRINSRSSCRSITKKQHLKKIKKALHNTEYKQYKIVKRSNTKEKEELSYVYAVDVTLSKNQERNSEKIKTAISWRLKKRYFEFPKNQREFKYPPVVIEWDQQDYLQP